LLFTHTKPTTPTSDSESSPSTASSSVAASTGSSSSPSHSAESCSNRLNERRSGTREVNRSSGTVHRRRRAEAGGTYLRMAAASRGASGSSTGTSARVSAMAISAFFSLSLPPRPEEIRFRNGEEIKPSRGEPQRVGDFHCHFPNSPSKLGRIAVGSRPAKEMTKNHHILGGIDAELPSLGDLDSYEDRE
jgi:hypothetical protein